MLPRLAAQSGKWICAASPRTGFCSRWQMFSLASAASVDGEADAIPAHLSYSPEAVGDMPTLLMMAQSAAAGDYKESSFWRSLSLQSQRLRPTVSIGNFAKFVETLAMARHRDDELMYNLGDAMINEEQTLDADTLGIALRAHALLEFHNDRVLARFEALLFEMMQASKVTPFALSAATWSLSKLFELRMVDRPSEDLLDAIGRMVVEHASLFSMQQLAEIAEAFGVYRLQNNQQISAALSSIGDVFARQSKKLSASHCASSVRAFAKCRVHDERLLSVVGKRLRDRETREALTPEELTLLLYGLAKFTCQDTALLDLLSIEGRRRLHLMDVPSISSMLASFAKAGILPQVLSSRAAVRLRRTTVEEIDAVSIQDLSNLAMAFGKLQARDQKLFNAFADSFMRRSSEVFELSSCYCLVHILHAFSKVHVVHDDLFNGLTESFVLRFSELSLPEIVLLLHASAKVEFPLPLALQEHIAERLQMGNVEKLSVFELLKLSTATRRLGMEVPALEAQLGMVLPHEAKGEDFTMARSKTPMQKRRKSARKRKWTW